MTRTTSCCFCCCCCAVLPPPLPDCCGAMPIEITKIERPKIGFPPRHVDCGPRPVRSLREEGPRPDPSPRESFPKLRSPGVIILSLSTSTRGSFVHPPSTQGMHACCGYLSLVGAGWALSRLAGWLVPAFHLSPGGGRAPLHKWRKREDGSAQMEARTEPERAKPRASDACVGVAGARGAPDARALHSLVASLACVGKTNSQPHTNACPPALPLQKKKALVPAW